MATFITFHQNELGNTPKWREDNYVDIDGNINDLADSIPVDEQGIVLREVVSKLEDLQSQIGPAIAQVSGRGVLYYSEQTKFALLFYKQRMFCFFLFSFKMKSVRHFKKLTNSSKLIKFHEEAQ